jgi:hypothetical protein
MSTSLNPGVPQSSSLSSRGGAQDNPWACNDDSDKTEKTISEAGGHGVWDCGRDDDIETEGEASPVASQPCASSTMQCSAPCMSPTTPPKQFFPVPAASQHEAAPAKRQRLNSPERLVSPGFSPYCCFGSPQRKHSFLLMPDMVQPTPPIGTEWWANVIWTALLDKRLKLPETPLQDFTHEEYAAGTYSSKWLFKALTCKHVVVGSLPF